MKTKFKTNILFIVLPAILLQTACTDQETKRLEAEQACQVSRDKEYPFGLRNFSEPKKIILKEMVDGRVIQDQPIEWRENLPYGYGFRLSLTDAKNKNYYQLIVDDKYLFTFTDIKIYAILHSTLLGGSSTMCKVEEFKVNGKRRFVTDSNFNGLEKKDAIILPVANSKK